MMVFRGAEESFVRDSCVRLTLRFVALRCVASPCRGIITIRNSSTVEDFMIARGLVRDLTIVKVIAIDGQKAVWRMIRPRCIALHLAVTGIPIIKTTMAARYEGITVLRRRPIKFRRLNVDFRAVYRLTVLPSPGLSRGHAAVKVRRRYNDEEYCHVSLFGVQLRFVPIVRTYSNNRHEVQ